MPVAADEALWFIRQLRHTKGKWAGTPFTVLPFQEDFIRKLLKLNRQGRREVKRALLGIARKNGKSELGAALALVFLILEREPGGEVIGAAAKRDQARLILDTAKRMVRYSKIGGRPLSDFLVVRRDHIYFPEMDAIYKVISADAEKEHGLNPHAVIFDELHVQGKKRDLWDALTTAQGARENPIMVSLSTAGPSPEGLCHGEYQYGNEIAAGVRSDPEFLMDWYEADPDRDVDDPVAWEQANPGLGQMVFPDFLHSAAQKVLAGKAPEYTFRRLHLNQWTTAMERWLPRARVEACAGEPEIPDGAEVFIGVDASLRRDSFGVAVVYVDESEGEPVAHVFVRAFTPPSEGEYVDHELVRTYLLGLAERYAVRKLVYDPAYMQLIAQQLADRGFSIEPYPQAPSKMEVATETFQRLVLDGRMRHGNQWAFTQALAGVGVRETDRGVRISKGRSGAQIDVITALVMALQTAMPNEDGGNERHFALVI